VPWLWHSVKPHLCTACGIAAWQAIFLLPHFVHIQHPDAVHVPPVPGPTPGGIVNAWHISLATIVTTLHQRQGLQAKPFNRLLHPPGGMGHRPVMR
jgi:hypothetical protein